MALRGKLTIWAVMALCAVCGQDLAPRAHLITPLHSNAITLTYPYYNGSLLFDGTAPITGATATARVPVVN